MRTSFIALLAVTIFAIGGTAVTTANAQTTTKRRTVPKTVDKTIKAERDRRTRKVQGDDDTDRKPQKGEITVSRKAVAGNNAETVNDQPTEILLTKAGSFDGDLAKVPYQSPKRQERPERESPNEDDQIVGDPVPVGSGVDAATPLAPAPVPSASFLGLDFTNFGAGRPPDPNSDVGPNHIIQGVNTSMGIFDKATGTRLVGLTMNAFMSQGAFGNLCDTNNFGDPVILYDSFEDRWIVTDFAFTVDVSGNVTSNSYQCFAVSKTGNPVSGGWNFYYTVDTDYLGDYPKFGVWTDGIYWSANMFQKPAGGGFTGTRVRAMNKAQMYAGAPSVQVVTFNAPTAEFTILPANARLQTGTPPAGAPNYFATVWQYTNAVSIYKFHVDWQRISLSTFTGPSIVIAPASWSSAPATVAASGGNANDTLATRLMVQNQYTNLGGVESVWNSHTVLGGAALTAAPRFYQVTVTGGTVAATTTQAFTHAPDTTINRYMPSVAVDKDGNMLMGYSASSSSLTPALRWAGRLAGDAANSLPQTETSLVEGTGAQTSTTRWGDYSSMSLDPDGCRFWFTGEYYVTTGSNWQTRIGSTSYPTCTAVSSGTISGTVTSAVTGLPINGATVTLGSRTTTTNASGVYTFSSLAPGTYPVDTADAVGYTSSSATNLVLANGGSTTQNFSLATAASSACLTDTSTADFQNGVPTNVDPVSSSGNVILSNTPITDQQNTSLSINGNGISTTSWSGQTFVPSVSGQLIKADVNLFCSGCTGTTPSVTVSVRATSGGLPTGGDLATVTMATSASGASGYFTFTFSSPPTLTSGTTYALLIRNSSNPTVGTNAITRSASSTYASGARITSADSGANWAAQTTDIGFVTYMQAGYSSSGDLVSGAKDANPVSAGTTTWTSISWNAATPVNTSLKFQLAASNSQYGPFSFVGPDGTASTYFTTSGASLSQFNGNRYLKYKAYLATTNSAATPTLNDVTICYTNPRVWTGAVSSDWNNAANWSSAGVPGGSDAAIVPATGVTNNPVNTTSVSVASLQLGSGRVVDTGANTLTVSTCSPTAISGGSSTSYVKGSLTRCVDNTGTYAFPVGTATGYSPVSLSGVAGSGNFNVSPVQSYLSGVLNNSSIQRYWGLTPTGGVTSANVTLTYLDADVPPGATESSFMFIRNSAGNNTTFSPSSFNTTTNTFTLNGVSSFSSWSLGLLAPTAAGVSVSGTVTANGRPVRGATVLLQDTTGRIRSALTNAFGHYTIEDVESGRSYTGSVRAKNLIFDSQLISVGDNLTNVDFAAQ